MATVRKNKETKNYKPDILYDLKFDIYFDSDGVTKLSGYGSDYKGFF